MLATGATITAMALTLGQTAFAQNDSAGTEGKAPGSGNSQAQERSSDHAGLNSPLAFAELQVKLLEKLTNNENRLKEKLAKVDTLKVSDEVKAKMKERLNARLLEVGKTISQINASSTKEDLKLLRRQKYEDVKKDEKRELKRECKKMKKAGRLMPPKVDETTGQEVED